MRAQHDGRLLLRSHSHHLEVPGHVAQRVGHVAHDLAREALISIWIGDAEGDAARRVRHNRPVAPVPAVGPPVQRIHAVGGAGLGILVRQDVVRGAIDLEAGVLDAVGIAARHATEVRVLLVLGIIGGIVPAADDVALAAGRVVDEEVGDGGAVGDEVGADANARDRILAVGPRFGSDAGDGGVAHRAVEHLAGDLGAGVRDGSECRDGQRGARALEEHDDLF